MHATELRRHAVERLSLVHVPYGFVSPASEVDRGSGAIYDAATLLHEDFARATDGCGQAPYQGSLMIRGGFRGLTTNLVRPESVVPADTTVQFVADGPRLV